MKIATIGNSHVASLKRAWDKFAGQYQPTEITFFASRGRTLNCLETEDRKLVPRDEVVRKAIKHTSGGREFVAIDDFDAFLIYGIRSSPLFLPPAPFYSKQVLKKAVEENAEGALFFKILKMIRGLTDKPIYVGHTPLRADDHVAGDQSTAAYVGGVRLVNELLLNPLNAQMLQQPEETITNGNRTHMKFAKGAKRLPSGIDRDSDAHPDHDAAHMNDLFGRLWLEKFFGDLGIVKAISKAIVAFYIAVQFHLSINSIGFFATDVTTLPI